MKLFLGGGVVAAWGLAVLAAAPDYPIQPVPFTAVRLTGGLWHQRQEVNRTVTVPFALQQCEDTGRLRNFDLAAEVMRRRAGGEPSFQIKPPTKFPFDDSDVFKAIEGAAYVLSQGRDAALEARLDAIIARIAAAQEPDGYLYTWRTMHPDAPAHKWIDPRRWLKDPEASHELYNIGHMYEAGVAYFEATGRRNLLDVCLKSAELVWRDFGDGTFRIAPGHQVIEMGLIKLYRVTGDERFLKLARIFLDARGPGQSSYNQRHELVVNQTTAVGHAVRANYMYAGMADVAALTGDARYITAIAKIWDDAASRKMYVTGSVGALAKGEAYGADYELPLDGYNETCAAIAYMMWSHRMFLLTGEARYLDVLERTAYNGALSGVALSGDRFFYPNPVVYDGEKKFNHGFAGRAPWFGCACCPPNVVRTLASLGGYFYAVRDDTVFVNLYGEGRATVRVGGREVILMQQTEYPWQGKVRLEIKPEAPGRFALALRIPGWVRNQPVPSDLYRYSDGRPGAWSARVNGQPVRGTREGDHLVLRRDWRAGDTVDLEFILPVRRVRGHPAIAAVAGRVALERGPVVYCVEELERRFVPGDLQLPDGVRLEPRWRPDLLGGVVTLEWSDAGRTITAIPYHAWNNRGLAPMAVWLRAAAAP